VNFWAILSTATHILSEPGTNSVTMEGKHCGVADGGNICCNILSLAIKENAC
jgi:hypothetical protein